MSRRRAALIAPVLLATACGGGGGSPTAVQLPRHAVDLVLFYDENGNGTQEPNEGAAVPGVDVDIAGQTGRSAELTGLTHVPDVPEGQQTVGVRASSLPPYYRLSGAAPTVTVPQSSMGKVALTLTIGSNQPNHYLTFGDSITEGFGSRDVDGYRGPLEEALQRHFGRAVVEADGVGGTKSDEGSARLPGILNRVRPAYTIILYGTNDWKRCAGEVPCYTVDALQSMIGAARAAGSLPVVGTIPPVNPNDNLPERNEWVTRMNVAIKAMAAQQRVPVAEVQAGFVREAGSDLSQLFVDLVHPNDRGYRIIADEFFKALSRPAAASSSSFSWRSLFRRP